MADSGPSDGAAAGPTFQLEVSTLAGGCLAAIPDAQGSWQLRDILDRLPEVLPGHRYQLLKGEAVLAPGMPIAEWARPVDGWACVTAVAVAPQSEEEQRELDVALIAAASELNIEKVRELLILGADATARHGFPFVRTALHAAADNARRPHRWGESKDTERDREEKEGRLQAVLGALLAARADVDAERQIVGGLGSAGSTARALHTAVQGGCLGAVRALLDAKANIDAVAVDRFWQGSGVTTDYESTALHAATQADNLPLVALLLERGANVNAIRSRLDEVFPSQQSVLETALHMAVVGGHVALVALLVQAGADASIPRTRGGQDTPTEELCAGKPGMLDALKADSSAALLAGGDLGPEVDAALAAFAARRAAAA